MPRTTGDVERRRPRRRPRSRRGAAVIVAAVVLLTGAGCSAAAPTAPPAGGSTTAAGTAPSRGGTFADVPLVPDAGVYWGMYYGDGSPQDADQALGLRPAIHLTYFGWADEWATSTVLQEDAARDQLSLVNWEPFDVDFADIVDGRYDTMLTDRARQAGALNHPVFLDFAAEMNEEEGWGGHDPHLYVAAYRHVHDIIDADDNGNVVWVWAPNNVDSEGAPAALEYYPGAEYVDWTGMDGYNWGSAEPGFRWQSFDEVFRPLYDDLVTLGKPVMIGETGSAEDGGSKAEWITAIGPTLTDRFPDIRAVVWFDVGKERDWRFRSSPQAAAATRHLMAAPPFASAHR